MARNSANKLYNNFTAGLITEASPLTYPENASVDEDNCVITRKGNRRRRLGIDYIDNYVVSSFSVAADEAESFSFQEFEWNSVNNDEDLSFLVTQVGATLYFWDISNGLDYPEEKFFTLDLTPFLLSTAPISASQARVSMAAGRGFLFVTGAYIEQFYVEYDDVGDSISATKIPLLIRDLVGLDDNLSTIEEPTSLSLEHKYNLFNQGWADPSDGGSGENFDRYTPFGELRAFNWSSSNLASYFSTHGRYPSNSQVWWVSKDATTNAFDPAELVDTYFGGTRAPRGYFIIDALLKNRSAVSGLAVTDTPSKTRPRDVSFWSGRVWWAHENDVYFSQVLEDVRQAGNCYQEADPTSEVISDLIDSDGGQIPIPEAINLQRLVPYGNGLLAFAENGVWHVRGTDAGFTARDYSVDKVSSIGIEGPDSIVVAGQNIMWWSKLGIQGIQQQSGMFGPISGSFETTNLSETTIQTFFNESIPPSARKFVKGHYDPSSNTVQWLFRDTSVTGNFFYNRILNYDLTLNAFYPWTLGVGTDDGPWLCGVFLSQDINDTRRNRLSRYIGLVPSGDNYTVAFAIFNNTQFGDWQTYEGSTGYAYDSYLITGFELMQDAMRDKEISHMQTYFTVTETTYIDQGSGDYTVDRPSSCKLRVRWDWADDIESGRWTREVEAYRHDRLPPVDPSDLTFNAGYEVLATRQEINGHGRAIQFEFSSDKLGHDFDLLGWSVNFTGNTMP